MSSKKTTGPHMKIEERVRILSGLNNGELVSHIAKNLGREPSTIRREILLRRVSVKTGGYGRRFNDCKKRSNCPMSDICNSKSSYYCKKERCSYCNKGYCSEQCIGYEKEICQKLNSTPFVCNNCNDKERCTLEKMYYKIEEAEKNYKEILSTSRTGIQCSEEEIEQMNKTFSSGFKKGQSLNHIYKYASDSLPISQRSAYNYINGCVFDDARRIDEPKAVRYRAKRNKRGKDDKESADERQKRYVGRTMADYRLFVKENPEIETVEMDCVEGKKGGNGRCLLTLTFTCSTLQIAIVLEKQDSEHVVEALRNLRSNIGKELYKELFSLILTDRGSEFSDVDGIQIDDDGEYLTDLFFCDGDSPEQKARCERNHSEVRRILKKGNEITFNQVKADLMMNNVNSFPRPQYRNKSSYETFVFMHGKDVAEKLGLVFIEAKDINLTPSLLS